MSALTMNPAIPHRKPLPGYSQQPPPRAPDNDYSHSRTRTSSSNVIPINVYPAPQPDYLHPAMAAPPPPPPISSRRTLSNATSSTSSTNNQQPPQRFSTNSTGFANGQPTATPRRSGSSRSTGSASPTSYVALMRRQKATVWCDRAQHEDPRILAARRAAKMRAAMEVAGGHNHAAAGVKGTSASSGMVGGVRSKIRHHGAPKASTYNANMLGGAGVPMRLSATEVDEGDSDDESYPNNKYHSRNGSGRSSMGSGHKNPNGSTPPTYAYGEAMTGVPEEPTPVPGRSPSDDYFAQPGGNGSSGGSGQREENFGAVGNLPESRKPDPVRSTQEDLRRRGSVDDRTMTMGGGRLFVANPDLSD